MNAFSINTENSSNGDKHNKSPVNKKIPVSEPSLSTNDESSADSIAIGRPKRTRR